MAFNCVDELLLLWRRFASRLFTPIAQKRPVLGMQPTMSETARVCVGM